MEAGLFRGAAAASAILAAIAGKLFTQACAKHAKARTLHSAGLGRRRLPGPRARRSRGSRNRRSSSIRGILLEAREPWRRGRGGRLLRLKQAVLQHRQNGNMSGQISANICKCEFARCIYRARGRGAGEATLRCHGKFYALSL